MGIWGGLRPPHIPNFLTHLAIPREPSLPVAKSKIYDIIMLSLQICKVLKKLSITIKSIYLF